MVFCCLGSLSSYAVVSFYTMYLLWLLFARPLCSAVCLLAETRVKALSSCFCVCKLVCFFHSSSLRACFVRRGISCRKAAQGVVVWGRMHMLCLCVGFAWGHDHAVWWQHAVCDA